LAGLRVGYGFFSGKIIEHLMRIKQPYNVNIAAQIAVKASLLDAGYLQGNISSIISERERLFAMLKDLGWLEPYDSYGNFILCSLLKGDARELWGRLRERGIFVRYFAEQRLQNCLRISAGRPEDSDVLLEALRDIEPAV
jgi:histidinol-phosphate aminotransferase